MDFSKLQNYIENYFRKEKKIPGCHIAVMQDHELLFLYRSGTSDASQTKPVSENDLYHIYSCTKPMTCAAAVKLIEDGKMELDTPVGDILSAYKKAFLLEDEKPVPARRTMTVRHLFTMSAGLDYSLKKEPIQRQIAQNGDTLAIVNSFVESPLCFEPGERYQYSLCHDVLGAVVEVVSGMKFSEYLRKNFWEPLGMTRTGFALSEDDKKNLAYKFKYSTEEQKIVPQISQQAKYQLTDHYESGGAGICSCVQDYILFLDAMACGGVGKTGAQILKPESIDLMRTNQAGIFTAPDAMDNFYHGPYGYSYGLGVRTLIDKSAGQRSALGEFGWPGALGSYTLMDPAHKLSICYTMHVGGYKSLLDNHFNDLRDVTYEAMGL